MLVQKKKPRKRHPSSAPASPVHSDAHVEAMRSGTRAALAALRHADRTGAVRRTRLDAARLRRLTMGPNTARATGLGVVGISHAMDTTTDLPSRVCIRVPFRADEKHRAHGCPAHGAGAASMFEHRQSDASSGRVPWDRASQCTGEAGGYVGGPFLCLLSFGQANESESHGSAKPAPKPFSRAFQLTSDDRTGDLKTQQHPPDTLTPPEA